MKEIKAKDETEISVFIENVNEEVNINENDEKRIEIINSYGRLNLKNNLSSIPSSSKLIKYGLLFGNIKDNKNLLSIKLENNLIEVEKEKENEEYVIKDIISNTGDISSIDKEITNYYITSNSTIEVDISIPISYYGSKKVMDRIEMAKNLTIYLKDYKIEDEQIFYKYNYNYNSKYNKMDAYSFYEMSMIYADIIFSGYDTIEFLRSYTFYIRSMISDNIIRDKYIKQNIIYKKGI